MPMIDPLKTAKVVPTERESDPGNDWRSYFEKVASTRELPPAVVIPVTSLTYTLPDISTMASSYAYNLVSGFKADELTWEAQLSPLGRRLLALRRADIASGMQLLDEDEILAELSKRRGGFDWP